MKRRSRLPPNRSTRPSAWTAVLAAVAALAAAAACSDPDPDPPAGSPNRALEAAESPASPPPETDPPDDDDDATPTGPEAEEAACRRNLVQIAQAVQAFRADHEGEFPLGFDELLGAYVTDAEVFACPSAVRLGREGIALENVIDPALSDPISRGYSWELTEAVMNPDGSRGPLTFREAKLLQMKTAVGDKVPIVRCFHHREGSEFRRCLNLTAQGEIYESELFWESEWVDQVARPYLDPDWLAQNPAPLRDRLPERPAAATDAMIDLRPWCTARIDDPWISGRDGEDLRAFNEALDADGLFHHEGVGFDAAGLVQLNGRAADPSAGEHGWEEPHYPGEVRGIGMGRHFATLHVLGGVLFAAPPDSVVAELRFHYADDHTESVPWRYGFDVANIGFREEQEDPDVRSPRTTVAWTGYSEIGAGLGIAGRLFHLEIPNPRPDTEVVSLDFIGGFEIPAPFLLALTIEP